MFWKNIQHPSGELKNKPNKKPAGSKRTGSIRGREGTKLANKSAPIDSH
jgi:hypothetical protein